MLSVEELQVLVATICNPGTDKTIRSAAERRLQELQSEAGSWRAHIQLLDVVEDTLLFFVCLGLQRIVWKQWNSMDVTDQDAITTTVVNVIARKSSRLPLFARSKAELVLSAICQNSYSFEPVLRLIQAQDRQIVFAGISALRTILEEVFQIDPRMSPASRDVLIKAVNDIISPATSLACAICQACVESGAESIPTLLIALSLLKVICGKVELGSHITPEMLHLLFAIAELGAVANDSSDSLSSSNGSFVDAAVRAVGVLSELMARRYIPRAAATQQVVRTPESSIAHPLSPGFASSAVCSPPVVVLSIPGKDIGADILVDLVVRAINLLKKYRSVGDVDESPVVLPLLEFITSFAECHLERCLSSPSSGMAANISAFLREIATLSCASTEPKYLAKVAAVWENLLELDAIQEHMIAMEGDSVCAVICSHLLCSSYLLLNPNMKEIADELEDDLQLDPFADPHIRLLVSHLGSSGSNGGAKDGFSHESFPSHASGAAESITGQPENAEELSSEGSILRQSVTSILSMLIQCPEVHAYLGTNLPQSMQSALAVLASPDGLGARGAAIDVIFITPLLPLVMTPDAIAGHLSVLLTQFLETRIYTKGKPFIALVVTLSQVLTQLIPKIRSSTSKATGDTQLASLLPPVIKAVTLACDTIIAPSPFVVMASTCTLYLQLVSSLATSFDAGGLVEQREGVIAVLNSTLLPRVGQLPLEVQALLLCGANSLMPDIAKSLAEQLHTVCLAICSTPVTPSGGSAAVPGSSGKFQFTNSGQMNVLTRLCGSLDALARHHAVLSAPRRQGFITAVAPLQDCLPPLLNYCFESLNICASSPSPVGIISIVATTHTILSLINGLLASLGRKSFGQTSLLALDSCSGFLQSSGKDLARSSFSGLALLKQMVQLLIDVATGSTSTAATTPYQITVTTTILSYIVSNMTDPQVCAEMLQPTIKAGTVSIACYWQRKEVVSASAAPGDSSVLPIARLLVQLFVGSMDPLVPPHEAQEAADGIAFLTSEHNLFSVLWFQDGGCWTTIASAVLRALLLQSHPSLQDSLGTLVDSLIKSDVSKTTDPSLAQGVWSYIGAEVYRFATEIGCGEAAGRYLNAVLAKYSEVHQIDSSIFVAEVVVPLSVDIARAKDV